MHVAAILRLTEERENCSAAEAANQPALQPAGMTPIQRCLINRSMYGLQVRVPLK